MKKINRFRTAIPQPLLFLGAIATVLLVLFMVSRIGMVFYNAANYKISSVTTLLKAFFIGIWFDIIVSCWLLFLPLIVLGFCHIRNIRNEKIFRGVRIFCAVVIVAALLAIGIDIPYFNFFNSRLNVAAVPRIENLFFALSFLSKEPQYYPFAIVFLFLAWGLNKAIKKIWHWSFLPVHETLSNKKQLTLFGGTSLALIAIMLLRPSQESMRAAYFTNDPFVNQVTLNPVFTYADSFFNDFAVEETIADSTAIQYMQSALKIKGESYNSPIARKSPFAKTPKINVVVILMESMSAQRMGWCLKTDTTLTPFLDKLTKKSLFFPNFYSWGIHTYNGIFSTFYGMPYNMLEHPMKNVKGDEQYFGMPSIFKDNGYHTAFFCTHDKAFDNIGSFIPKNGYLSLYDVESYTKDKHVNDWGVGDETLLDFSLLQMDTLHKQKKPFFFSLLTNSNHPPFTFPSFSAFKPTAGDARDRGFQYADWALREFFKKAEKKPWFKNTVFVLVGDHGVNTPSPWEATLSYSHVPCYFYAPSMIRPNINNNLGNQIDILPTLMEIIKMPYVQNTLGCNLLKEKRPYVVFSQDHKLCVVNKDKILIQRKGGTTSLYQFNQQTRDTVNLLFQRKALADSMQLYAAAMLKVTKLMIEKDLLQKPQPKVINTKTTKNKK